MGKERRKLKVCKMCIVVVLAREKEEDPSKGDGTIRVTDIGVGWGVGG